MFCFLDKENPVIVNLPTSFTRSTDSGKANAVVSWTAPTATDNSNGVVTLDSDPKSGTQFVIGPTTVTYTATDPYNNVDTKSFVVTVQGRVTEQVYTCVLVLELCALMVLQMYFFFISSLAMCVFIR